MSGALWRNVMTRIKLFLLGIFFKTADNLIQAAEEDLRKTRRLQAKK